jgi:hypothetical protein
MPTTINHSQTTNPLSDKDRRYRTPPGHRVLHLIIDQQTFNSLHIQAIRSGMKFTAYMQRFLKEAFPFDEPEDSQSTPVPDAT